MSVSIKSYSVQEVTFRNGDEHAVLEPQQYPVCEWIDPLFGRAGDKMVFVYACVDENAQSPNDYGDTAGEVVLLSQRHSRSSDINKALAAMGMNSEGRPAFDLVAERHLGNWICDPIRRREALHWTHEMRRPWWANRVQDANWNDPGSWMLDGERRRAFLAENLKNGKQEMIDLAFDLMTNPQQAQEILQKIYLAGVIPEEVDAWWLVEDKLEDMYDESELRYTAADWLYEPELRPSDPFELEWVKFALTKWREMLDSGELGVKYTQSVDVYEHGSIHISLSDSRWYPDEQWDVSRGGGVWIPNKDAIENLDTMIKDKEGDEREKIIRKYAAGCIEMWNDYWNGDVYGVIRETHTYNEKDEYNDSTLVEEDSCWDHYGVDYTEQTVKEYFETEVEWIAEHPEGAA